MLRLLDAPEAFARRGYNSHVTGELHLALQDATLPEASGRFVVRVEQGRAQVERGGLGAVQIGERALAALYAGHRSASELARLELLRAPANAIAMADAMLSCHPASMADYF